MTGEHEGVYYPLTGMSKDVQQQLIDDHFLFKAIKIFHFHNKNLISRKETDFSRLPMPAGTGPQAAGSSTTRARPSWCGAGRRTTSGSSACRRGGTWARCSVASRREWRRSRIVFHSRLTRGWGCWHSVPPTLAPPSGPGKSAQSVSSRQSYWVLSVSTSSCPSWQRGATTSSRLWLISSSSRSEARPGSTARPWAASTTSATGRGWGWQRSRLSGRCITVWRSSSGWSHNFRSCSIS